MSSPSERRLLVIHFGLPKTGSSTIQEMLRLNRDTLRRLGVAVSARDDLTCELRSSNNRFIKKGGLLKQARQRLALWRFSRRVRLVSEPVLLVSDENLLGTRSAYLFAPLKYERFEAIAKSIDQACRSPDLECRYVVYTRDLERWRKSSYNQSAKTAKHLLDFQTWCDKNDNLKGPDQIVEKLRAALGERLVVVAMEDELGSGVPLGSAVLSACGLSSNEVSDLKTPQPSNVSMPPNALELIRILGEYGLEREATKKVTQALRQNGHLLGVKSREHND
ncbi:hypothetical protein LY39_03372 [Roseinatronobacter bogoriensis subsp. barguzinensis]|nr:hypothetical protein LY39_03372 [Rhodobaca barguzinensis]TDY67091.1 hypothetical protein EV660_10892 [Rhodobaca bogoriensis DSM 18756]